MLRWLILVVLIVIVSASAAMLSTRLAPEEPAFDGVKLPSAAIDPNAPAPVLVVDQALLHDFGIMAQQKKGRHKWIIKNEGEGVLNLIGTEPTCSCTVLNLKRDETYPLKPGESYTLDVEWETRGNSGPYEKQARVLSNDPKKPDMTFIVKGIVRPSIVMMPPEGLISTGNVSNLEPKQFHALIGSPDRPETKILSTTVSRPELLDVEVTPLTKDELAQLHESMTLTSGYRVTVTVKPTPALGAFSEEVVLKTDHPDREEVRMTVAGKVVGPISVMPSSVRLSEVSSRTGDTTSVMLWVQGQEETEFTVVEKPDNVKVAVVPVDVQGKAKSASGRSYRMTVTVEPGIPSGVVNAPIVLKTNHPKAGEVHVPVQIVVVGES